MNEKTKPHIASIPQHSIYASSNTPERILSVTTHRLFRVYMPPKPRSALIFAAAAISAAALLLLEMHSQHTESRACTKPLSHALSPQKTSLRSAWLMQRVIILIAFMPLAPQETYRACASQTVMMMRPSELLCRCVAIVSRDGWIWEALERSWFYVYLL